MVGKIKSLCTSMLENCWDAALGGAIIDGGMGEMGIVLYTLETDLPTPTIVHSLPHF
jgi:hypothetical protein